MILALDRLSAEMTRVALVGLLLLLLPSMLLERSWRVGVRGGVLRLEGDVLLMLSLLLLLLLLRRLSSELVELVIETKRAVKMVNFARMGP
jgi:hypothetical protein